MAVTGVAGVDAGGDELLRQRAEVWAGHVEDEGGVVRGGCRTRWAVGSGLAGGVVGGGEDEAWLAAVRSVSGVLRAGGGGEGGGDAGDDLEGDVGGAEGFDLFAGAAEDERVAGFEAEDGLARRARAVEHEGVDPGLGDARLAAAFADGE